MARRPLNPVIVFNTLEDARAALAVATERQVPVTLRTAPGAAAYAGPGYLKRIAERALDERPGAQAHLVIDCGDDAAVALAAIRLGWKRVAFTGAAEVRAKLADIARKSGAKVVGRGRPASIPRSTSKTGKLSD